MLIETQEGTNVLAELMEVIALAYYMETVDTDRDHATALPLPLQED